MELDFELVRQSGKYHKAAVAVPRLPQKATYDPRRILDVDDGISTYCAIGQISDPDTVSEEYEYKIVPLFIT